MRQQDTFQSEVTEKYNGVPIGAGDLVDAIFTDIAIRRKQAVKLLNQMIVNGKKITRLYNLTVSPFCWMKIFRVTPQIRWKNVPGYIGSQPAITDLSVWIGFQQMFILIQIDTGREFLKPVQSSGCPVHDL